MTRDSEEVLGMAEKRPNRVLGPNHDTFWEYCNKGEFRLQKCNNCGAVQFPPSPACPECLSLEMTWTPMTGTGTILSHTTFIRQYYPECPPPWHCILVQIDEGPSFVTNPRDRNVPEAEMKAGTRVKVAFVDAEDAAGEFKMPLWETLKP